MHWEGTWKETAPFYTSPESRSGRKPLHGSFSRGPSAIWRKVELPDRPPFYYSEQFGISTWKRPLPPPPMHPIAIPSTDFRAVQPEWDLLTDEDRRNLLYGLQRLSELQVPTAPPPAYGEEEEEEEEEEEGGGRSGESAATALGHRKAAGRRSLAKRAPAARRERDAGAQTVQMRGGGGE